MLISEIMNPIANREEVWAWPSRKRFRWAKFIYLWLTGIHMSQQDPRVIRVWKQFARYFPNRLTGDTIPLYRVITVPIAYAKLDTFEIKPAHNPVSSWTQILTGAERVHRIAKEHTTGPDTARICIRADIPVENVVATPETLGDAFYMLTYRYDQPDAYEPYPEALPPMYMSRPPADWDGHSFAQQQGWNKEETRSEYEGEFIEFTKQEVEDMREEMDKKGGWMRQYEVVVLTPPTVMATRVRNYRVGDKVLRRGKNSWET